MGVSEQQATEQQATEQQATEQQDAEQQDAEYQDAAMQVDTVLKPELGKQDDDVEVTWESHPRTPKNLEVMEEWRKLESLKAKKRKFLMEVENADVEIEAQKVVLRARFEEAVV